MSSYIVCLFPVSKEPRGDPRGGGAWENSEEASAPSLKSTAFLGHPGPPFSNFSLNQHVTPSSLLGLFAKKSF